MRTIPSILSLTLRSTIMAVAVMGTLWAQTTTGKIAGRVVDDATGDPIPGANVLVDGTALGAATDANGDYFIIAVPPGTYSVRAQVIGYAVIIQSEVRVLLNLTTTADFSLTVETIAGEEVRVVAKRPMVQPDVSANVANIEAEEMENLPVAGVSEFINLQAGIEPGMTIRGMGTAGLSFVVDGTTMRDGRSNSPFSAISYTAISEVQIQTGGFNAEYGNVRSGVINVITKVPEVDRYMADVLLRYSPPHSQVFGDGPDLVEGPNSFYIRPYMDKAVAWEGTQATDVWDQYTQRQYPAFEGWNAVSETVKLDDVPDDPTKEYLYYNNLTPKQLQEVFKFHHRKELEIIDPEYDIDLSLGGPVIPGLSRSLGNLRFLASYRKTQDPYMVPMERNARVDETYQLKLMADLGANMKLMVNGLYGTHSGISYRTYEFVENPMPQWGGVFSYPWSTGFDEHVNWGARDDVYGEGRLTVTDVTRKQMGATFTHTLSPSTFYKLTLTHMNSDYDTVPFRRRNELLSPIKSYVDPDDPDYAEKQAEIDRKYAARALDSLHVMTDAAGKPVTTGAVYDGYYYLDEAPIGWTWSSIFSPGSGLRMGGHWGIARDNSSTGITTAKFDLTNQTNSWSQLRAGLELNFYDFDMLYKADDSVMVGPERTKAHWERKAMQGAVYLQEKLEFRGMIANLGLRVDYYNPGKDWWDYTTYDSLLIKDFYGEEGQGSGSLREEAFEARGLRTLDKQVALSPRVGVSFPITAESKLFFNYGHFRDIPNQRQLFQIATRWNGAVQEIGNPEHPLLKTVAYELGYEHSILDQYLLRLSGYYQDRSNQPNEVEYQSQDAARLSRYEKFNPISYGDVRGLEVTLNKTVGRYLRGFVNYTYMITKSGNFGFQEVYENPTDMSNYARRTRDHYQSKPVAMPFGRFNLDFFAPANFGPAIAGIHPLGDWRLDLLGSWRAGETFTWTGPGAVVVTGLTDNVRMRDFTTLDIRLSKNFETGIGRAQFFVDITNVLNLKYLYFSPGDVNSGPMGEDEMMNRDYDQYMTSLHLPEDTWEEFDQTYLHPYGDDRPGYYRKAGVAFVPIETAANFDALPDFMVDEDTKTFLESDRRVLGWTADDEKYYEFDKDTYEWEAASKGFVDDVLDDRAYIDMPNRMFRAFQNPRSILFGLRVWF